MVFNRKADPKPFDLPAHDSRMQAAANPFAGRPGGSGAQPAPSGAATPADEARDDATLVESVIGSDLAIEGQSITIRCKGLLRVNGDIQADLHGRKLIVGSDATITGAIQAETVDVHGKVQGTIDATSVMLRSTSEVEGDISSRTLSIEPGAAFDGRVRKLADDRKGSASGLATPSPLPFATA